MGLDPGLAARHSHAAQHPGDGRVRMQIQDGGWRKACRVGAIYDSTRRSSAGLGWRGASQSPNLFRFFVAHKVYSLAIKMIR